MLSCNFIDFVCAVILHLLVEGNEIYKFAYLHKNNLHITMFWHCIAVDALLSVGSVFFFLFFFFLFAWIQISLCMDVLFCGSLLYSCVVYLFFFSHRSCTNLFILCSILTLDELFGNNISPSNTFFLCWYIVKSGRMEQQLYVCVIFHREMVKLWWEQTVLLDI